jgi:hypothetical protein
MDKPHSAAAVYETQYQLIVDSEYGDPQGAGYYAAGSTATFSVTSPTGFLIQQVFTGWDGDFSGTDPTGTIAMDAPHRVHANWTTSYLQLGILAAIVVAIVVVLLLLRVRRRRGPAETKEVPPAGGEQPPEGEMEGAATSGVGTLVCPSCGANVPMGQKFCENCGKPMPETT